MEDAKQHSRMVFRPIKFRLLPLPYYCLSYFCYLQKLNYTFVGPVPSSTASPAALGGANKVVYSAVRPHDHHLRKPKDKQDVSTTSATSAHVCGLGCCLGNCMHDALVKLWAMIIMHTRCLERAFGC